MSDPGFRPINVGIAGLGRSGWGIHANALAAIPQWYRVVAALDHDPARRAEAAARFGCRTHESFESLIADSDVELVVVATPNHLHVPHTIAAMAAGRMSFVKSLLQHRPLRWRAL